MRAAIKVPQLHPFLNSAVILDISNGLVETAKILVQADCVCEKAFVEKNWKSPTSYSVYLDIESPPYRGQILFHFTTKTVVELCKKIVTTNKENSAPEEELLDCVGELSNQAYGIAKSKLNIDGCSFKMTTPHPIKTEKIAVLESKFPSIVVPFKLFGELCYIQPVLL